MNLTCPTTNQQPELKELNRSFSYTAPAPGFSTLEIDLSHSDAGVTPLYPTQNRTFGGKLFVCQQHSATATSGWAGEYTIIGVLDASSNLSAVYLSGLIGSCGPGTPPEVTVYVTSATAFTIKIYNTAYTGTIVGFIALELGFERL